MLQEMEFIESIAPCQYLVKKGFVPNMRVPGTFYVNDQLCSLIFEELQAAVDKGGVGGFLPAVKQIANVAALPGIVQVGSLHRFPMALVAATSISQPVLSPPSAF